MIWLFLLFLTVPILEIALFISVGQAIGLFQTLGVVVLTAVIGTWLVRSQGLSELARLRDAVAGSGDAFASIAHGAMILVAGILLLTPGFFTDGVGFLLLVPAVRVMVARAIAARIRDSSAFVATASGGGRPDNMAGDIIDADFDVVDESGSGPRGTTRPGRRGA